MTGNVLLLVVDTLRYDRLGCNGGDGGLTPNMDRLTERGARFTQAITSGTWTQAAMPGILTSTYASMYNGCLGPLAAERPSPVEALAGQGYQTAAFVSNPLLGRAYRYDRGFTIFQELDTGQKDPPLRGMRGGQFLLRRPAVHAAARIFGRDLRPARVYAAGEDIVDAALGWLRLAPSPFFGWLHFMDVHWPYHLETDTRAPGAAAAFWQDLHHFHAAGWKGAAFREAHRRHYTSLYERSLRYLDAQIGRLLDALAETGRLDDTLIILTSDHGEEFLEHGRWGHWEDNLHEEILRVPLLVHDGGPGRRKIEHAVQTLDILPTVLDLAGVDSPPGMLGVSLRDLLADPQAPAAERVTVTEMLRGDWHRLALRASGWKTIWDSRSPDAPIVYDLHSDPSEQNPLHSAAAPDPARFRRLVAEHLEFSRRHASATSGRPPDADADLIDRLRRLGYVE